MDIVDAEARGSNAGVATTAAGDNRRNRLLNVAMRSKAAAAAVEGSNYEDEVCFARRPRIACIHKAKRIFPENRFSSLPSAKCPCLYTMTAPAIRWCNASLHVLYAWLYQNHLS